MRRIVLVALLALAPLGCCHPLKLLTANRIKFDNTFDGQIKLEYDRPVFGSFNLRTDTPPTRTDARVVAMPLDGQPPGKEQGPKVAIVDVDGILLNQNLVGLGSTGDNPVALFKEKLDTAAAEPGVCAVVLRINTPGGAVNASELMFQELLNFRGRTKLPVVACCLDMAAGGGYYLAAGCDMVVAQPTSVVGGVGVIWNGYDVHRAQNVFNFTEQFVKSGEKIDMGSVMELYPPEVEKLLKKMVEDYHGHFKARIRQARPRLPETCKQADDDKADPLDGRVMTGIQAVGCGLVDRLGYLDDAVAAARDLAGQPQARTVLLHRSNDPGFSAYATTPNVPLQMTMWPFSIPGIERTKLPNFLFMWLPEPTADRLGGR